MEKKSIGDTPVSQMTYRMYLIGQVLSALTDVDDHAGVVDWVDGIIARMDAEHAEDAPEPDEPEFRGEGLSLLDGLNATVTWLDAMGECVEAGLVLPEAIELAQRLKRLIEVKKPTGDAPEGEVERSQEYQDILKAIEELDKDFKVTTYKGIHSWISYRWERDLLTDVEKKLLFNELMRVANKHTHKPGEHDA